MGVDVERHADRGIADKVVGGTSVDSSVCHTYRWDQQLGGDCLFI